MRRRVVAAVLVALVFLAGCRDKPKLVTVTGRVMHGGKTVAGGSVWFHPQGTPPGRTDRISGQLQADGTFTARTFPYGDGIPPGSYKVTLSPDLAGRAGVPQYADAAKTPWALEVPESGVAEHVFEIR